MSTLSLNEKRKLKVLFLIHDLGNGGAEKVLVNLVNNLNRTTFDITVISLFGGGVNEQFLKSDIRYLRIFPKEFRGNIHIFKLFTPKQLHKFIVKDKYDVEVSYLEGPSARIISGCNDQGTRLISWIHSKQSNLKNTSRSFRNEMECKRCYERFDQTVCVSNDVMDSFTEVLGFTKPVTVLYNVAESDYIQKMSEEMITEFSAQTGKHLIAVGTLKPVKGFLRLIKIVERLYNEGYYFHLYILGDGPQKEELSTYIANRRLSSIVTLLGYQLNPYKYVSKADLFICSSYSEGFSTAVTEALIVGTPVISTDVSGMKELLGVNNEYGIITDNNEESLYAGIKQLLDDEVLMSHYAEKAAVRGKQFSKDITVKNVEKLLSDVI